MRASAFAIGTGNYILVSSGNAVSNYIIRIGYLVINDQTHFVSTHPSYARRLDLVTQRRLVRPEVRVVDSLELLVEQLLLFASRNE